MKVVNGALIFGWLLGPLAILWTNAVRFGVPISGTEMLRIYCVYILCTYTIHCNYHTAASKVGRNFVENVSIHDVGLSCISCLSKEASYLSMF